MKYDTDDLLYGFMRGLSTAAPEEKQGKKIWVEYLKKIEFVKNKKVIAGILNCSTKTIDRHLEKLISAGLVKEEIMTIEKIEKDRIKEYDYEVYKFPYDYYTNYEIIPLEMVRYLVDTRNTHAIRIYIYLLNKYKWKLQTEDNYIFTVKELKLALGYSETTKTIESTIRNILDSFAREGMIKYKKVIDQAEVCGNGCTKLVPVERMALTFVAQSVTDLP